MPFVVPGQQQPQPQQQRDGRGGGMERRDYASQQPGPAYRPPQQQHQQRGGGYDPWQQQRQQSYRQPQRQQQRGGYQSMPQPMPYRDPYGQRNGGRQQYQQPQPMPYNTRQQRGYEQGRQQMQPQYEQPVRQQMPAQGSDEYNRYDPRARAEMDAQRSYQQQYGNMNGYRSTYDQPQQGGRGGYAQQQAQVYSNRPMQGNYVGEGVYADGTPMPPVSSSGYNGQSLIQSNAGPAGGVYSNFNQTPEVNGGVTPRAYLEEDDVYNKPMYTRRGEGGIR